MNGYEWGIWSIRCDVLHRGPWAEEHQAQDWINEWIEDGGDPEKIKAMFYVVNRRISNWEMV